MSDGNNDRSQLTLYCASHVNDPSLALEGLRIWDDAFAGLYTKLRTNTHITQLAMGISYNNGGDPTPVLIDNVLVLQGGTVGVAGLQKAVGIGTSTPTATLDVSGNVLIQGDLTVGDAIDMSGTAVAIGYGMQTVVQDASSIVINANAAGFPTNFGEQPGFFVNPVRGVASGKGVGVLVYEPTTGEITYSTT